MSGAASIMLVETAKMVFDLPAAGIEGLVIKVGSERIGGDATGSGKRKCGPATWQNGDYTPTNTWPALRCKLRSPHRGSGPEPRSVQLYAGVAYFAERRGTRAVSRSFAG